MPLPVPRDGSSIVGRPAARDGRGAASAASAASGARAAARRESNDDAGAEAAATSDVTAEVPGATEEDVFMAEYLSWWPGQEEEAQHQVHRDEAHDDAEKLALGKTPIGPADVGGTHRPHAPQQEDGEDEAQGDGGDGRRREAAVSLEGRDLIGGWRHGASLPSVSRLRV